MAEAVSPVAIPAAPPRVAWTHTLDPFRTMRRPTREVRVGDVGIGGKNPIRLQSMTIADTLDTPAVVDEICALAAAGSEIVRVTAPNRKCAENLAAIRAALAARGVRVPLVADIHFTPQAALIAALHVEKVRINPGNYADRKHFEKWEYTDAEYSEELERLEAAFRPLVLRCKERGVAMRIGTNHGSLSDRILNRYGDTPLGMVESALEFVRICEHHGYGELVLSMKASDVKVMIEAYRLLAARMREAGMDYPFHLGVTEAGGGLAARVKSTVGIASLLADGIGDTVRVSLTEDSVYELPVARALAARAAAANSPPESVRPEPSALLDRVPPWDPYRFRRRACASLGAGPGRLAADQPPRVEIVVDLGHEEAPDTLFERVRALCEANAAPGGADLLLLAPARESGASHWGPALQRLALWTAARPLDARPALGLEVPFAWLEDGSIRPLLDVWARLALAVEPAEFHASRIEFSGLPPVQYTLSLRDGDDPDLELASRGLAEHCATQAWPRGAVALDFEVLPGPHAWRRFLAVWSDVPPPIVLRASRRADSAAIDAHITASALDLVASLGALLADGVGDAIQLRSRPDPASAARLGYELLQATRLRLTKADFIACPSCGRTQFDLQSTTARIEARFGHLEGLKIAVMGCIVNGPGEMADADFGYVGSGPGKIDLYVGHERVERNVSQADAVERLVALIRERGLWVDPPRP